MWTGIVPENICVYIYLFIPLLILMNKPNVDRWRTPDVGDCGEREMIRGFSIISK